MLCGREREIKSWFCFMHGKAAVDLERASEPRLLVYPETASVEQAVLASHRAV